MDASRDHVTGQQGDSPLDDIIQEDTSMINDDQNDEYGGPHDYNYTSFADVTASHDPPAVPYRQQNRKRKKKNQSLREMVF